MTGSKKSVAVANLADAFSQRAQNIIESATNEPPELFSRKVGWAIESRSKQNMIRFHITTRSPDQTLIIKKMVCTKVNGLPGKLLNLIFSFAREHGLSVTFEVSGLPKTSADFVEKTYNCERTGELLVYKQAA